MLSTSVAAAEKCLRSERIDWLFIRIRVWDHYQRLARTLSQLPSRVVFLLQRRENCTGHLTEIVDAHLKPPYSTRGLGWVWDRLSSPTLTPRPLDFFFLKTECRYEIIRYHDLRQVRFRKGRLQIYSRLGDYEVAGSLIGFQARLPVPLTCIGRDWLVNKDYRESDSVSREKTTNG